MRVAHKDPAELHIHPALKNAPRWAENSPHFLALVADIAERGFDAPLAVTETNQVVDGRHRLWAARRLQLAEVPTREVGSEEVATIIVQSLLQRRHYNDSQRAYIAFPFFEAAYAEAVKRWAGRRKNNLIPGAVHFPAKSSQVLDSFESAPNALSKNAPKNSEAFAGEVGVCPRLFEQAAELYKHYRKHPELRDLIEPDLLREDDPVPLGAALAGIGSMLKQRAEAEAGRSHPGGRPQSTDRQLDLFENTIETQLTRWQYWQRASAEAREAHWQKMRERAAALPPALCAELAAYHRKLGKLFERQGYKEEGDE